MNWVGGSLHRHSRGARSATLQRQKAHFAKIRHQSPQGPSRHSPANNDIQECVTAVQGLLDGSPDSVRQNQRSRVLAPAARRLTDPHVESSHERDHGQARRREARRQESASSRLTTSSEVEHVSSRSPTTRRATHALLDVETERQKLLSIPDWLGLLGAQLSRAKQSPAPSHQSHTAKRRRLNSVERKTRLYKSVAVQQPHVENSILGYIDVQIGSQAWNSPSLESGRGQSQYHSRTIACAPDTRASNDSRGTSQDDMQPAEGQRSNRHLTIDQPLPQQQAIHLEQNSVSSARSEPPVFQGIAAHRSDLSELRQKDVLGSSGDGEQSDNDLEAMVDRAWLSFLGVSEGGRDLTGLPEESNVIAQIAETQSCYHLHSCSNFAIDDDMVVTPRGLPSRCATSLLTGSKENVPDVNPRSKTPSHEQDVKNSYDVQSPEHSPANPIQRVKQSITEDPNEIWKRFVFGSNSPELEYRTGSTIYAVTLHDGEKTPSPKSIAGHCSSSSSAVLAMHSHNYSAS